jgi:hypothetical protein
VSKSIATTTDVGTLEDWRVKAFFYSEIMEDDDKQYWTGFADALQMLHDGLIRYQ